MLIMRRYPLQVTLIKFTYFFPQFLFTDTVHKYLYVTFDYARTVWPRKLEFTPTNIITHPTDAMVIIVHDTDDPVKKVKPIASYTVLYFSI